MTTEQPKPAASTQEHTYHPPPIVPYPHVHFNGGTFPPPAPPGAYHPQFFTYAPPDGNHTEANGTTNGSPSGPPYMYPYPPGMVYAYPPPASQGFSPPAGTTPTPAPVLTRPKRKQVKMACTNCAQACKRCDEGRPCERCIKYGIADTCVDGQRKERKKGVKRGPYKRKNKANGEASLTGPDDEWQPGSQPSQGSAPLPNTTLHPVPPFGPPPEGFYPMYYPPPSFVPPVHDGQTLPEGATPPNGQPPVVPFFFPAYPPYPPPGAVYHPIPPPNHTPDSSSTKKQLNSSNEAGADDSDLNINKKRTKGLKGGDGKHKRSKPTPARGLKEGEADEDVGDDNAEPAVNGN